MIQRRGLSLMEVSVAGVLLGVLLTICLQLLGATAARRRAVEDRQTALVEAGNVMERLAARPWDDLTPENAAVIRLSQEAQQTLDEGGLEVSVTSPGGQPEAKRITVTVRWQEHSGQPSPARPVRLVAWRYRINERTTTKNTKSTKDGEDMKNGNG